MLKSGRKYKPMLYNFAMSGKRLEKFRRVDITLSEGCIEQINDIANRLQDKSARYSPSKTDVIEPAVERLYDLLCRQKLKGVEYIEAGGRSRRLGAYLSLKCLHQIEEL